MPRATRNLLAPAQHSLSAPRLLAAEPWAALPIAEIWTGREQSLGALGLGSGP